MDLMTSTMQFVALNFISTSAYQILKGGIIATAFLFTVIYLRQPIKRNELIGSVLAFSGIIVVGVGNVLVSGSDSGESNIVLFCLYRD